MHKRILALLMLALCLYGCPVQAAGRSARKGVAQVSFYCPACTGSRRVADPKRRASSPMGVAADPRYHPLGSLVYIEGFGTRRVDDTGGRIKGPNRFDVRLSSRGRCHRYGVKRLSYRVLSKPKKKQRHSRTRHR